MEIEGRNIVNVSRQDVLDGGFRAFRQQSFIPTRSLSVRFSGEDGIDTGGLSREFMRLAVNGIKDLPLFEGTDNCKMIGLNYKGLYASYLVVLLF